MAVFYSARIPLEAILASMTLWIML